MKEKFLAELCREMIRYDAGDEQRINHFLKVHGYAAVIGRLEGLDEKTQLALEAGAYVHDIGIHVCEEKYNGNCGGKLQEKEGPPIAEEMLKRLGAEPELIRRVSYLVAHHHTYKDVEGMDYRILLEADFLVNMIENEEPEESIRRFEENVFRTESGKQMLHDLLGR